MSLSAVTVPVWLVGLSAFAAGCLVGGLKPGGTTPSQRLEHGKPTLRLGTALHAAPSTVAGRGIRTAVVAGGSGSVTPGGLRSATELARELDPGRRHEMLTQMMTLAAPERWANWAQEVDPWLKPFERQFMLATWAGVDAREAIRYVKTREMGTQNEDFKVIADRWAGSNPGDVLAAIRDESEPMAGFARAAVEALAERDVAIATQAMLLIKPSEAAEVAEAVVARLDPQAVEELMQKIEPSAEWGAVRAAGYSALAQAQSTNAAPNEARSWAENQLGDEAFVHGGLPVIADSLDRAEALTWLSGLPLERASRESVVLSVYSKWLENEAYGATVWLLAHPNIPDYDQVAAQVANAIAVEDPEAASAWAATVHDPDMRQGLLDSLYASTTLLNQ